jgi:hypothetical protein
MKDIGVVLIDDFHRLPEELKHYIADYIKLLADTEDGNSKIIVVGINRAGESLIRYAADITGRIDRIKFEANPQEKIIKMVSLGEAALNVSLNIREEIAQQAQGSFHIAQMLCHTCCLEDGILEQQAAHRETKASIEIIRERVLDELSATFFESARKFATGPRLRREGRAPYFFLLFWLSDASEWSLSIDDAIRQNKDHRGSVGQIVDKGYLLEHIDHHDDLRNLLHFEASTKVLSVEDPKFVYYLRNLLWTKFAEKVGYRLIEFTSEYDFALSFAGADRDVAQMLFSKLTEREISVFYDKNEQHRILAENVEDYLAPIYKSEATFVIALLGPEYPKRIWTKFESDQFRGRFGEGAVIPIWFDTAPPGLFDETARVGGLTFSRSADIENQVVEFVETLSKKIAEKKEALRADAEKETI